MVVKTDKRGGRDLIVYYSRNIEELDLYCQ